MGLPSLLAEFEIRQPTHPTPVGCSSLGLLSTSRPFHAIRTSMKTHAYPALLLGCFFAAPAAAAPLPSATVLQVETTSAVEDGTVPEGLLADDWVSLRAAYEAERHAFFTTEQGYEARSHGNAWRARFEGQGFTLEPDAGDWSFGLKLVRYGFESELVAVDQAAVVRSDGQRLTYDWDEGLSEWWKNDRCGLEHGFTVHERPQGMSDGEAGPLVFDMAVRGDLRPSVMASGRGLRLASAEGSVVLTYDGLVAFDADGTPLETWLEARATGMRIAVLDEGARYPLTVDPIMQTAYLKASNTDAGDEFGFSVAISGDTVVVGAPEEDSTATGVNGDQLDNSSSRVGAAYVFIRTGGSWSQQAYLKASNPEFFDRFGYSVAISGDTLVVGAPFENSSATGVNGDQSDNSAANSGAAYVFVRTGGTWSQRAYLKASNTDALDRFGFSVGVSGDTVVVGSPREDSAATAINGNQSNNSAMDFGAAYVFLRSGGSWSQQAYLKASNSNAGDEFGSSVALSGDTVVVGAYKEDSSARGVNSDQSDNSAIASGAAYVFARIGGTWTNQAYLKASNTDQDDRFGSSVAVFGDTVIVGAFTEGSSATGVNGNQADNSADGAGAAYVYVRTGRAWSQQAYLKASNTDEGDAFGASVALSGDTAVVGGRWEDGSATGVNGNQLENGAIQAGAAYVFLRRGNTWSQQAYLKASNTDAGDFFGWSVGASEETVVVGSWKEDSIATGVDGIESDNTSTDSGGAYVFDMSARDTLGSDICQPALANSTGIPGKLSAVGSDIAADNNVTFLATDLPPAQFGFLINAMNTQMVMISDGVLCIGPDVGRHSTQAGNSGMTGAISTTVDLSSLPRPSGGPAPALAGQTWYFQFWHRDGPGASNFTNGIEIQFQ